MILFLGLDAVEQLPCIFVREFKDAGVIQSGRVLFGCQNVAAQIGVVLFFRCFGGMGRREGRQNGRAGGRRGNRSRRQLVQEIQVLLLGGSDLGKQVFELRIRGAGGVSGVFIGTHFFLILQILEKSGFFLCQLQCNHLMESISAF